MVWIHPITKKGVIGSYRTLLFQGVPAGPGIPGEASPPERSPLHRSGDSGKPLPERPVRKYRPGETEEDFLKQKEDEEIIKQRKIRQSVGESPGTHSFVPKQGPQKQRLHPEEPVFLAEGEMAARPSMERAGEL